MATGSRKCLSPDAQIVQLRNREDCHSEVKLLSFHLQGIISLSNRQEKISTRRKEKSPKNKTGVSTPVSRETPGQPSPKNCSLTKYRVAEKLRMARTCQILPQTRHSADLSIFSPALTRHAQSALKYQVLPPMNGVAGPSARMAVACS